MSIAQGIEDILAGSNTFTLYGGFCIKAGSTIRFQTGTQECEKRNEKGQVTIARYRYADNSQGGQ